MKRRVSTAPRPRHTKPRPPTLTQGLGELAAHKGLQAAASDDPETRATLLSVKCQLPPPTPTPVVHSRHQPCQGHPHGLHGHTAVRPASGTSLERDKQATSGTKALRLSALDLSGHWAAQEDLPSGHSGHSSQSAECNLVPGPFTFHPLLLYPLWCKFPLGRKLSSCPHRSQASGRGKHSTTVDVVPKDRMGTEL